MGNALNTFFPVLLLVIMLLVLFNIVNRWLRHPSCYCTVLRFFRFVKIFTFLLNLFYTTAIPFSIILSLFSSLLSSFYFTAVLFSLSCAVMMCIPSHQHHSLQTIISLWFIIKLWRMIPIFFNSEMISMLLPFLILEFLYIWKWRLTSLELKFLRMSSCATVSGC